MTTVQRVETSAQRQERQAKIEALLIEAWEAVGPEGTIVPRSVLAEKGAESFMRDGTFYDPFLHAGTAGSLEASDAMERSLFLKAKLKPYRHAAT